MVKILVVRNDRLGDALMALPALQFLRKEFPSTGIDFYCNHSVAPALNPWLFENSMDSITHWVPGELRREYETILFLHSDRELMVEAWREWIGVRVGVYSKPVSFLLLTGGMFQRRSQAKKNEAEYNLELAAHLLWCLKRRQPSTELEKICLPINPFEAEQVVVRLRALGLGPKEYVLVHPGMGRSALNWSINSYIRFIQRLRLAGEAVVISQGPAPQDREIAYGMRSAIPDLKIVEGFTIQETMELFRNARTVIAPSTGPLHLAHYVGTETIGIYSPVRAHSSVRWAPWGGAGKVKIVEPHNGCQASRECLGNTCSEYFCLDALRPDGLLLGDRADLVEA